MASKYEVGSIRTLYLDQNLTIQEIAKRLGCGGHTVHYHMKRQGIPIRSASKRVTYHPSLSISPSLSYAIGVMFGDGSAGARGWDLSVTSKAFAERFAKECKQLGLNATIQPKEFPAHPNWQKQWRVLVYPTTVRTWWLETPIERKLDLALFYPKEFIEGLFDSEGSVFQRTADKEPRIAMDCGKKEPMCAAYGFLRGLGFNAVLRTNVTSCGTEIMRITIDSTEHVHRFLTHFHITAKHVSVPPNSPSASTELPPSMAN